MLTLNDVLLLASITTVLGQGKVPLGPFTTELHSEVDLHESIADCDNTVSCAGVTFRATVDNINSKIDQIALPFEKRKKNTCTYGDIEDDHRSVFFHGFIPKMKDSNSSGWETHRSTKTFVLHRGKLINGQASVSETVSNIDLDEAKARCESDPFCVGFTFPVHSGYLFSAENVTFATSISEIEDYGDGSWRTYISNDDGRASSVDHLNVRFDEENLLEPYVRCCGKHEAPLPSIAEIQNIDTLERIPCSISREEFYEKYEVPRKPVMLVGCDEGWPANDRWTFEALIPRFRNDTIWRANLGHGTTDTTWQSIVEAVKNDRQFYIFDQLDNPDLHPITEDYETPAPFQNGDLYQHIEDFPPEYGSLRWFCVGSKFSGTMPHMDPAATDAWNTLLSGHKWWVLFPTAVEYAEDVECSVKCSVENPTEAQWYSSVGISAALDAYGSTGEHPRHILQKPGETIYVPFGIVHSVMNMDRTFAITSNYASAGNLNGVWETVMDSGRERDWKKFYYGVLDQRQRGQIRNEPF